MTRPEVASPQAARNGRQVRKLGSERGRKIPAVGMPRATSDETRANAPGGSALAGADVGGATVVVGPVVVVVVGAVVVGAVVVGAVVGDVDVDVGRPVVVVDAVVVVGGVVEGGGVVSRTRIVRVRPAPSPPSWSATRTL